ncbi:flagellar hook-associated protein FlgK [Thermobrachium celere]|uniref:flagellar hook-associated protein FlgK n=1 Tax=Thermobrachium celere TaxID=53422 RepID=UPI001942174C|nr:flagellar hook-associated protein FlgK [Thermobrachium celere]GFR36135.1 flagellar hook-associated protein FlgK [Thermobrachium celere]
MSGLFNTFNIVKRGMQAQQTALHVISHNVANANTEGYSIQRANLKTSQPFGMPSLTTAAEPGQLGTGVLVDSITRSRDEFLDYYIRKETSTLENYKVREQFLSTIETIFTEPSNTGIATLLTNFWDAWQGLASNPESQAQRELVRSNAEALCNGISHNYKQLEDLEVNIADLIQNQIFEVSSILKQISDLNQQIKAVTIGGKNPNDLMDKRDLLLDKLSERFAIEIEKTDYNGIKIYAKDISNQVPGVLLVSDSSIVNNFYYVNDISFELSDKTINKNNFPATISSDSLPLEATVKGYKNGDINEEFKLTVNINDIEELKKYFNIEQNDENIKILNIMPHILIGDDVENSNPINFSNGSLKGLESLSFEINDYKKQLNNLARGLAISVNTIHSGNTSSDGINFFNSEVENSDIAAKIISIDQKIKENLDNISANKQGTFIGNGERALLIGQLRNTRFNLLGLQSREDFISSVNLNFDEMKMTSNNSGTTIDNYFKATISQLGVSNQEAKRMVKNQENLVDQLVIRRESVSGVSLDEEMTNMLQFQRAYEANAKMISVIDELLDLVVNGLIRR